MSASCEIINVDNVVDIQCVNVTIRKPVSSELLNFACNEVFKYAKPDNEIGLFHYSDSGTEFIDKPSISSLESNIEKISSIQKKLLEKATVTLLLRHKLENGKTEYLIIVDDLLRSIESYKEFYKEKQIKITAQQKIMDYGIDFPDEKMQWYLNSFYGCPLNYTKIVLFK